MRNLLRNCYYDGMTKQEAIEFIERCYWETPTERQISGFVKTLGTDVRDDWK